MMHFLILLMVEGQLINLNGINRTVYDKEKLKSLYIEQCAQELYINECEYVIDRVYEIMTEVFAKRKKRGR